MFHVRTCERDSFGLFTMATDNQEELTKWWDALQQHLLDQGQLLCTANQLYIILKTSLGNYKW